MALSLCSSLLTGLGFRHGFSLRQGGVSTGPYSSLNLGRNVGDEPDAVLENQRLLAAAVGYDAARLYEVRQVHGGTVERASRDQDPAKVCLREADALISDDCVVGIKVADCVSILLADPATGAVAAAHAGWRGVVAEVVARTVHALAETYGSTPSRLVAATFPCIGVGAFEVGDEVAAQLVQVVHDESVVQRGAARPHVDLARCVQLQLGQAGLAEAHIDLVPGCTFDDSARFFSFRRDRGVTGRHLAVIEARC